MKPYKINFINAIVLIAFGSWAYFDPQNTSFTALIPLITGTLLLALTPWFKKEDKIAAHVAVLLTFLIVAGLLMPLLGAIERADNMGIFKVVVMLLSSMAAMVVFINSFVQARRKKD